LKVQRASPQSQSLCPCPDSAKSNSAEFGEFEVRAMACAGIEIYDLVNVSELFNGEKKEKKKGL